MNEVAAALLGAVAGALLTGAFRFYLELRRERSAARVAMYVFRSEIDDAHAIAEDGLGRLEWPMGWKRWSETWTAYREPLARRMRPEDFARLAKAYERLYELEHGLAAERRKVEEEDRDFFGQVLADVAPARELLNRLLAAEPGPPHPAGRWPD